MSITDHTSLPLSNLLLAAIIDKDVLPIADCKPLVSLTQATVVFSHEFGSLCTDRVNRSCADAWWALHQEHLETRPSAAAHHQRLQP